MTSILLVTAHFPSPWASRDGQANYLVPVTEALARISGFPIEVRALRIGDQAAREECPWGTVHRAEPPAPIPNIFALYEPAHFPGAIRALERTMRPPSTSVAWCHGYETGAVAARLRHGGTPVVAVIHYLVAQESLHDLAVGDDPVRRQAFDSPLTNGMGALLPPAWRPGGVRCAARLARAGRRIPAPVAIRQQFIKLDLERRLLKAAHRVMAVSPAFAESIVRFYPFVKGRIGWTLPGLPRFPEPAPAWPQALRADGLRIVMVGRPTGQKGWDYVAEALHRLEGEAPREAARIEFAAIGGLGSWGGPWSGYSDRVLARFQALRHVRFLPLGELPHSQVLAHMQAADVLLVPSIFEPFGLVLLEGMQAGCYILASDADGPRDLVRPPWGRLVPFQDPRTRVEHLLVALRDLLSTGGTGLRRLGGQGRDAAISYSWDDCARGHWRAIDEARR